MQSYKKIRVWEQAHNFVIKIYKITEDFPQKERYGLTSQLQRAASSVPINIAEGSSRYTDKDFSRFINIALASCSECEYILFLCKELNYISEKTFLELEHQVQTIRKMLTGLYKRLIFKAEGR